MNLSVVDMHCDLLSFLLHAPEADATQTQRIGCSLPSLEDGNVKLQVMAIYTATGSGSSQLGIRQAHQFEDLLHRYPERFKRWDGIPSPGEIETDKRVGIMAAIENASSFCEEDEDLAYAFQKLESISKHTGGILYIGFTHHGENRFGGGNTTNIGLKEDGKALLEYMHEKKIALDLAHTSDTLAYDMLNYMHKQGLDIPVIASHSNYRTVFTHPRNLPDDIAKEIIKREGLIGVNFLRAFVNNDEPDTLYTHILYGLELGGESCVCLGADYFYTDNHPDQSRRPFFFAEHQHAGCYPAILKKLAEKVSPHIVEKISSGNALRFIRKLKGG